MLDHGDWLTEADAFEFVQLHSSASGSASLSGEQTTQRPADAMPLKQKLHFDAGSHTCTRHMSRSANQHTVR